jgi:exodeoxyribonuclease V
MSAITLTEHQLSVAHKLISLANQGETHLPLTGSAGTGKSTVLDEMGILAVREGPFTRVVYLTTTGRAMFVLSKKVQADVKTVHSYLYGKGDEEMVPVTDIEGEVILDDEGEPKMRRTGKLSFGEPNPDLPKNTLFAIDEASMMAVDPVYSDFMKVLPEGSAIMPIGDPNQLPPVKGMPIPGFEDGGTRVAHLNEIHRQAWDSPIVRIADKVRRGERLDYIFEDTEFTGTLSRRPDIAAQWMYDRLVEGEDVTLIAGTNNSRQTLNDQVRRLLGREDFIEVGDRMLAFKNDHVRGLMNGETFEVVAVDETRIPGAGLCLLVWREGDPIPMIVQAGTLGAKGPRWAAFTDRLYARYRGRSSAGMDDLDMLHKFLLDKGYSYPASKLIPKGVSFQDANRRMRSLFSWLDYGYCLTVHKSQGSEYKHVGYYRDHWIASRMEAELRRKMDYTAITRSSKYLSLFG